MHNETFSIPQSNATGTIGIMHLQRYWAKQQGYQRGTLRPIDFHDEIDLDTILLCALGIGMEQTIRSLPSFDTFDAFEKWILEINEGNIDKAKISRYNQRVMGIDAPPVATGEGVLASEDLAFFHEHGYVIVRNAVPKDRCRETISMICEFLGIDLDIPDTWYSPNPNRQGIMVQLFQHDLLQRNRMSERIRIAFEQLWGTTDLWVNTDRAGFNAPETPTWPFPGPLLHWDVSLHTPIPFGLQGILYLSDTQEDQGAFSVVPGFHHRVEQWLANLPAGADPREQDLYALGVRPIAAKAGDFIIWHHALPHGSSPNTSTLPRIVQYINYLPSRFRVTEEWK